MLPRSQLNWYITLISAYFNIKQVSPQVYISDCNTPFLANHQNTVMDGHTYCDHACRPNLRGPTNVCSAAGICLCTPACFNGGVAPAPPQALGNDYCPLAGGPFNTPLDEANCQAMCAGACPGGFGGQLCKENEAANDPVTRYRTCTCLCPAQPCPVVPPVPPVPVPVVPDPEPEATLQVNLIAVPIFVLKKIFKKFLLIIKKMYILCWFIFKIYLLQVFLCFCLKELASHYFGVDLDLDFVDIYNVLRALSQFI